MYCCLRVSTVEYLCAISICKGKKTQGPVCCWNHNNNSNHHHNHSNEHHHHMMLTSLNRATSTSTSGSHSATEGHAECTHNHAQVPVNRKSTRASMHAAANKLGLCKQGESKSLWHCKQWGIDVMWAFDYLTIRFIALPVQYWSCSAGCEFVRICVYFWGG